VICVGSYIHFLRVGIECGLSCVDRDSRLAKTMMAVTSCVTVVFKGTDSGSDGVQRKDIGSK